MLHLQQLCFFVLNTLHECGAPPVHCSRDVSWKTTQTIFQPQRPQAFTVSVHEMEQAVSVGCDQTLFEVKEQACLQKRFLEDSRALGRGLVSGLPRFHMDLVRSAGIATRPGCTDGQV